MDQRSVVNLWKVQIVLHRLHPLLVDQLPQLELLCLSQVPLEHSRADQPEHQNDESEELHR